MNGRTSATDWLRPQADGSFVATGHLAPTRADWSGEHSDEVLIALVVPEDVGGFKVFHFVPLVARPSTPVKVDGRRNTLEGTLGYPLQDGTFDQMMYSVTATFTVQNGWIRADSLTLVRKNVTPEQAAAGTSVDYAYPDVGLLASRIAQDATLSAAASPWLDVSDKPGAAVFMLDGWSNFYYGDMSTVSVNVPDRLGPAAIYHLAEVWYPDAASVPAQLREPGVTDWQAFTYGVRLERGRLVGAAR